MYEFFVFGRYYVVERGQVFVAVVNRRKQFGICFRCGGAVCRYFYFGQYAYSALGGVFHNLAYLVLCVVGAFAFGVYLFPFFGSREPVAEIAQRAYLGEFRVAFYLEAPSRVVNEVPVEGVHLQAYHFV